MIDSSYIDIEYGPEGRCGDEAMNEATKKTLLKKRARLLAATMDEEEESEGLGVVEFMLDDEKHAIEMSYIREVYPLKQITPLPGVPDHVAGIMNVRGEILSILDIKHYFNMKALAITDLSRVIIIQNEKMAFGILADEVLGVRYLSLGEIQPPLPTMTGIRQDYTMGITTDRTAVWDADKLLCDPSIVIDEEIA